MTTYLEAVEVPHVGLTPHQHQLAGPQLVNLEETAAEILTTCVESHPPQTGGCFPSYYYCSANNPDGTSWDNPIAVLNGFAMTVGEYPVVLEHNNSPYIGCYNLSTTQLFFARPIFE